MSDACALVASAPWRRRRRGRLAVAAGCGGDGETPTEVVLLTHDSFAISKDVKAAFEDESGLTLRVLQAGDANETLNRALLTAGDPQGDVIFGIDDAVLSRALEGDLLEEYDSDELTARRRQFTAPDDHVTPIDHGEVCLNVDRAWFAERGSRRRATLADLTLTRYRDLLVSRTRRRPRRARVPPRHGRAVRRGRLGGLLARAPGERRARGRRLGGGVHAAVLGRGGQPRQAADRRLVRDEPRRRGDLRVEAARRRADRGGRGRLLPPGRVRRRPPRRRERGRRRELIDFMLSERFQADVPGSMFVYPVRDGVALPEAFVEHAIVPEAPLELPPDEIDENRDRWVARWTEIVVR